MGGWVDGWVSECSGFMCSFMSVWHCVRCDLCVLSIYIA